ncbi:unnamed protein product [Dicrocoelium dendriticum]|nr:unnamed protein product [Dicrocoelium dendriticum]
MPVGCPGSQTTEAELRSITHSLGLLTTMDATSRHHILNGYSNGSTNDPPLSQLPGDNYLTGNLASVLGFRDTRLDPFIDGVITRREQTNIYPFDHLRSVVNALSVAASRYLDRVGTINSSFQGVHPTNHRRTLELLSSTLFPLTSLSPTDVSSSATLSTNDHVKSLAHSHLNGGFRRLETTKAGSPLRSPAERCSRKRLHAFSPNSHFTSSPPSVPSPNLNAWTSPMESVGPWRISEDVNYSSRGLGRTTAHSRVGQTPSPDSQIHMQVPPKAKEVLTVELVDADLWRNFHSMTTEMVITKSGR